MQQKIDLLDASTEREGMEGVARQRQRLKDDARFLKNREFQTYKGRLWTFVRPMSVVLPDGSEVNMGGWPHGHHVVSDRPELFALLKQEAIRFTGSTKGIHFNDKLKLRGIIPVLESFAYVRHGNGASCRWDRLYLKIQQIADGEDDSVLLIWGQLDPFNVHKTKYDVKIEGYFNTSFLSSVSCIGLSTRDMNLIKSQDDALVRVQTLYGL